MDAEPPDGDQWEAHEPTTPGWYWLISCEVEDKPDLIQVTETEGGLLAHDPYIGPTLVKHMQEGLIDACWQPATMRHHPV